MVHKGPMSAGANMSLPLTAAEVLRKHVTLELESIDRMYLNLYVPDLQRELGVVSFFRYHRKNKFASSALMSPMTRDFVAAIESYARTIQVPIRGFASGERKEDIALEQRRHFGKSEGVYLIGKAQEKARLFRTERRYSDNGLPYPWIVRSTAMVNQYYFYCLDDDFGPFFLKFCSYFPYTAKLCLNGHEYVKRQLVKRGIGFEALDNGLLSCADPGIAQRIADGLSAEKIDALARRWLSRLPHPFTVRDRRAGYRYDISILQAEFSLTQILDQPVMGRIFFEDVIRENLDIGRPDQVQLIFKRRVSKRTPGRFRTRVITEGVTPSLHVDYKHSRIKQYHKEGRGLRTETTINDARDFDIGKRLKNLPLLREVGFQANRRLLDVQTVSADCAIGDRAFQQLQRPAEIQGQRVSALRFADPNTPALLMALVTFVLHSRDFTNEDLREQLAPLLGMSPRQISKGRMSYNLRRLRLRGLTERRPKSHRYRVTPFGLKTALFNTLVYSRVLRPGLATLIPEHLPDDPQIRVAFRNLESAIDNHCRRIAA